MSDIARVVSILCEVNIRRCQTQWGVSVWLHLKLKFIVFNSSMCSNTHQKPLKEQKVSVPYSSRRRQFIPVVIVWCPQSKQRSYCVIVMKERNEYGYSVFSFLFSLRTKAMVQWGLHSEWVFFTLVNTTGNFAQSCTGMRPWRVPQLIQIPGRVNFELYPNWFWRQEMFSNANKRAPFL